MRQLVFHGPRRLAVEEASEPRLEADEVRVAVHSVGVCGSDVHGYAGTNARRSPGMVMGHEIVGTIVEVGADAGGLAEGDAVVVNPILGCGRCPECEAGETNLCEGRRIYGCVPGLPGAYAESFVFKAANAVRFEGPAQLEWGALVEPLSVSARAVGIGGIGPGDDVLVVGGGPIGIGAALAARRRGAARVVVTEPLAHRREVAERLGFETLDPTAGEPPRSVFQTALECVGHSATLAAALAAVRPKGHVVFVGLAEDVIEVSSAAIMVGERRITGSAAYTPDEFRETASWVASAAEDLSPLIELRVGLDELPQVFEDYADGRLEAMKTLLQLQRT
jgi:2-desacetyl-2-hydroxyethyl bacteriochlorophyllide A dehydrogenase